MEHLGESELYRIINRAIAQIGKETYAPLDREINLYENRYSYYIKKNPVRSLFDERLPLKKEVSFAQKFCAALEVYRLATDIDEKDPPELKEHFCRVLYDGITEVYKDKISQENDSIIIAIKESLRSRLPEHRALYILENYNKQALHVYNLKKQYLRRKRKGLPAAKDYERFALSFFEATMRDEELKKIRICPEKLELYINTLRIIDCLPKNKYNKTSKFKLKSNFCLAVCRGLQALYPEDKERAKQAYDEHIRFQAAVDNALSYATNVKIISAIRYKRMKDEWDNH